MQTVLLAIIAALLLIHVVNESSSGDTDFGISDGIYFAILITVVAVVIAVIFLAIVWGLNLGMAALGITL
jgi:hypothetical protein